MSDATTSRFLGAIAERVSADRVEELHLFQPIRQGGMESRVAVVAVREESQEPDVEPRERDTESRGPKAESRLAIHTARYRLTLKGPERGKWDFVMQAEADAPLVTVDAVVRGVQRRSGDAEDPARLSGEEFRTLLSEATA